MKTRSPSVWDYVNSHIATFTNSIYSPNMQVLIPDTAIGSLHVWTKYYLKR
jgi:hypothetical protein